MGELLLEEGLNTALDGGVCVGNGKWSVEKRFRVTEVFLAVLWVCTSFSSHWLVDSWGNGERGGGG